MLLLNLIYRLTNGYNDEMKYNLAFTKRIAKGLFSRESAKTTAWLCKHRGGVNIPLGQVVKLVVRSLLKGVTQLIMTEHFFLLLINLRVF